MTFWTNNNFISNLGKRETPDECVDTLDWATETDCLKHGFTAEQECTAKGWTCNKYTIKVANANGLTNHAWCADGAPLPKFKDKADNGQWPFGKTMNYPEDNCCVCGKGRYDV